MRIRRISNFDLVRITNGKGVLRIKNRKYSEG